MTDEQKKAVEQLQAAIRAVEQSGLKIMQDTNIYGRPWYSPVGYADYVEKVGAVLLMPF